MESEQPLDVNYAILLSEFHIKKLALYQGFAVQTLDVNYEIL